MKSISVKKLSSVGGFSSIELLSSMFIFAVVSLGVTSSTVTAVQTNRASQQKAVAVNLAHQALEFMKSQIQAGRSITAANAGGDCNPAGAPAGYALTVPEAAAGTGAYEDMTRVQITISWTSPKPDFILLDSYLDT
jgi:Tfp pilus assembly protein PilV